MTKTKKKHCTTQTIKKMSNTDPNKKNGMNPGYREG